MSSKAKWKYGLKGARSVTQRCPVVIGKSALVTFNHGQGSKFQGTVSAIDIETGEEQWRFDVNHFLNEPSISSEGNIFITCFDGSIYKLGSNGVLQWKSQPSECNLWSGLVVGDKFYYAEIAGRSKYTRALNASDGSILWEYENGGHSYALATDLQDYIVHCSVSGGFDEKSIFLHCINKDTGEVVWKSEYDQYLFQPLIVGNHIYIGSRSHVALFNLENGELLATYQIEDGVAVTARPIKTGNGVVFVSEKGRIFCLNIVEAKKGMLRRKATEFKQSWSLDLLSEAKARLVLAGSQLLVITEAGNLLKINRESGEIQSQEKLTGFKEGHGMAVYENDLLVSVSKECARLADKI